MSYCLVGLTLQYSSNFGSFVNSDKFWEFNLNFEMHVEPFTENLKDAKW